ncbi:Arylsulfotransferase (ASST) [Modicisalibacter muralis]|uniref:Arylsulfotransferase (ASST) n=1 Tax=Modicisalibacter muralis TaxID=119000 RepID=A0A1G9I1J5_9GAMM|nr:arylsulfotransferase family protein [Halomonas muralis]SDL18952.1 Arylsulfotransferase (ASST) [Halomonas muralis]
MPNSKADKVGGLIFFLALLFIAFVGGAILMLAKVPPYKFLSDAYDAGIALIEKNTEYDDPLKTNFWNPARSEQRGVTINDSEQVYPGYTLYTSTDNYSSTRLVAMDGTLLHEWRKPYSELWTSESAVDKPQPDELVTMREARVYPNGDLLAQYIASGDSPYGYGIVKLDSESNVIWKYLEHAHHDIDIGPDGRIAALTHEYASEPIEGVDFLEQPYIMDYAVILSPEGKELEKIPLLPVMARSRYDDLLVRGAAYHATRDALHTNGIEFITAEAAENFPYGEAGDLLISFRNISTVAVLDPESEEITWATRGPWIEQHDADLLPNGDIMLFDNYGNFENKNLSRVLQFDPENMEITWSYHGTDEHPLSSAIRSSAQRLPNGNTLITESNGGRLLEVTREGDIVWEYFNPVRGGNSDQYTPVVSSGTRIDPASLKPEFRSTLESGR